VPGRIALTFATIAVVLGVGLQLVTVAAMIPSDFCDLVAYSSVEAEHAAHYNPGYFAAIAAIHLVPSFVAVALGMVGIRRPRPVGAAIALGLGIVEVISGLVAVALIPLIPDAAATAASC